MPRILTGLILVLTALILHVTATDSFDQVVPRIVDGHNASDGEFPYTVSIRYYNKHECGGSIISEKWVLSAAHCAYLNYTNVSNILYGTKNVENGQALSHNLVDIKRVVVHPDWQYYGGYFNDIALFEVETPFVFSKTVTPVILPYQYETPPFNELATLVGWGYPEDNRTVTPVLQEVHLLIHPDEICSMFFGANYSTVSHICAGGAGRGQCTGDSGGALTVNGVQQGIVSWSDKPCATTPGVLTRVSSFRDWIYEVTGV